MDKSASVLFFSLLVFGFLITVAAGQAAARYYRKKPFSFLNEFPFELNRIRHPLFGRLIAVFVFVFSFAFVGFGYAAFWTSYQFVSFLIMGVMVMTGVGYALLFFIDERRIGLHVTVASIFMVLVLLFQALVIYNYFVTPFDVFSFFLVPATGVSAVVQLAVILNPRLKNWAKMEETGQGDNLTYIRPKVFVLPLSEWISVFNLLITSAVILISILA